MFYWLEHDWSVCFIHDHGCLPSVSERGRSLPKVRSNQAELTRQCSLLTWYLLFLSFPSLKQISHAVKLSALKLSALKLLIPIKALHPLLPSSGPFILSCTKSVLCNARAKPPKRSRDLWCGFSYFFSCGSYNIIKNPLNFNVPYKICALVKASTDNYFWWINQEDKSVWSSCCSIQFLLYTSPAGAITVMFQLVVSRASSSHRSFGWHEPCTIRFVLRAHF